MARSGAVAGLFVALGVASSGCNAILGNELHEGPDSVAEDGDGTSDSSTSPLDGARLEASVSSAEGADATMGGSAIALPTAINPGADAATVFDATTASEAGDEVGPVIDAGMSDHDAGGGATADATPLDGGCDLADIHSCGACDHDCTALPYVADAGLACAAGRCTYSCAPGHGDCGDAGAGCVTALTSPSECGGCGVSCSGATPSCAPTDGGTYACASGCSSLQTNCNGSCANLSTDDGHCGSCGNGCAPTQQCAAGTCVCPSAAKPDFCSGTCTNLKTDPAHCGSCGLATSACPTPTAGTGSATCSGAKCGLTCSGTTPTLCGTACVNLKTDRNNCAACGTACPAGASCSAGTCVCGTGLTMCAGACVNVESDQTNCGECNYSCETALGCVQGKCSCTASTSDGTVCTRAGGVAGVCSGGQCLLAMGSQGCAVDGDCVPGGCFNTFCLGTADVPGIVSCVQTELPGVLSSVSCTTVEGCTTGGELPGCGTTSQNAMECDGPSDCASGQDCCAIFGGQTCYAQSPAGSVGSGCAAASNVFAGIILTTVCDPRNPTTSCPAGQTCGAPATSGLLGFYCR